jgi:hypothetical protein
MNRENFFLGILAAGCFVATFMLMPSVGARIDQGGQSVLRRGAYSRYALHNGL